MQNVHNSIYITYDSKSSFFRFSKVLKSTRTKNLSILNVQFLCRKLRASIKAKALLAYEYYFHYLDSSGERKIFLDIRFYWTTMA